VVGKLMHRLRCYEPGDGTFESDEGMQLVGI